MPDRRSFYQGVNVLEMSNDVGAAHCGQILAMKGAHVTRFIDQAAAPATATESFRQAGVTRSAAELSLDRDKYHVLAGAEDFKARIQAALVTADVIITDYALETLAQLGLDPQEIRVSRPDIIFTHVSVFGLAGPHGGWRGGDFEAQAASGMISQMGSAEAAPVCMPYKAGLVNAGLHGAAATGAALYGRRKSGRGTLIDISAQHVLAASVRNYSLLLRFYDLPLARSGRRPPGSLGRYPTGIFPCKDGYVVLIARSAEQFANFLIMIGEPEWSREARYQDVHGMAFVYPDEVDALISPWLMQHTRDELVALGLTYKFPIGPLVRLDEVLQNEQLAYRDFFETVSIDGQDFVVPGNPAHVSFPG